MTGRFYNFNKKVNSTATPTDSGAFYNFQLKDESSIIHPTITCNFGLNTVPTYNYLYFPSFSRYYFINNWSYGKGIWTAECDVDVLASWKSYIGDSTLFVVRSSSANEFYLNDDMYPAVENIFQTVTTADMPWVDLSSLSNFYVVMSMLMRPANYAGLAYHVFTAGGADTFTRDLYESWQATISDPTPYLRNAILLPYRPSHETGQKVVLRYGGAVYGEVTGGAFLAAPYETFTFTINVPDYDQRHLHSNWYYHEPFSVYELDINPWGVITLDSYTLAQINTLTIEIRCDNFTGLGLLRVKNGDDILYNATTQIGIPIDIGGSHLDAGNIIGALGSIAGVALAKTPNQLVRGIGHAVGSGLNALQSSTGSTGGSGGVASLYQQCKLIRKFMWPTPEDNTNNGKPLCENKLISQLSGFIQAQKGVISAPCTSEELNKINSYMESGFYYE